MSDELALKLLQGQEETRQTMLKIQQDMAELKQGQQEIIDEVAESLQEICKHIDKRWRACV